MNKVVFLNSHPIQYFTPLYEYMTSLGVNLEVIYCSNESILGNKDVGFGVKVKWDIPLLNGYKSVFLRNFSWKPSIYNGFFGLINFGIISYLYKNPKCVIVIHGWSNFTNVLAMIFGKLFGHTVCLRAETPLNQELLKNRTLTTIKNIILRFIFNFIDYFLFIGKQNKLFYQALGVKDAKLIYTPYCVDNDRFNDIAEGIGQNTAREKLNLPLEVPIVLFSGKYILKKRPFDLLKAIQQLKSVDFLLVMVGDGELRKEMDEFLIENHLEDRVILTGFINQSLIPFYYAAADIFVMCSGVGETWGLSVNEAMNFSLPLVVSATTGCCTDLVQDGKNGYVFETENIGELSRSLTELLIDKTKRREMGGISKKVVNEYSYDTIINNLKVLYDREF